MKKLETLENCTLDSYNMQMPRSSWDCSMGTNPQVQVCSNVWSALLQICSTAEKKAIDKMIDSGPQLAGSMEYNVVLSEYLSRLKHALPTNLPLNSNPHLHPILWHNIAC